MLTLVPGTNVWTALEQEPMEHPCDANHSPLWRVFIFSPRTRSAAVQTDLSCVEAGRPLNIFMPHRWPLYVFCVCSTACHRLRGASGLLGCRGAVVLHRAEPKRLLAPPGATPRVTPPSTSVSSHHCNLGFRDLVCSQLGTTQLHAIAVVHSVDCNARWSLL